MKKLMSLVIGLAMLAPGTCLAQSLTARQILDRVSDAYRNLGCFRITEDVSVPGIAFASYSPTSLATEVAECEHGKVRVSNKLYLFVSNGETSWTSLRSSNPLRAYLRRPNQYIEVGAAPLLHEKWADCPRSVGPLMGLSMVHYLYSYMIPAAMKPSARLAGEKSLEAGGRKIECYVLDLDNSVRSGGRNYAGARRLWIDKTTFLIRKDELIDQGVQDPAGTTAITLKLIGRGPVADAAFQFTPPPDATRVSPSSPQGTVAQYVFSGDCTGIYGRYELGDKAPDVTLSDLAGKQVQLGKLRGKIVVLDFWASWCKRCRGELAAVEKLHDEPASKGLVFLGIDDEPRVKVEAFAKAHGYTFPMLLDSNQDLHQLLDVLWVPTTVVINRKGKIAARFIGAGGEAQLLSALKKAGLKLPAASARK